MEEIEKEVLSDFSNKITEELRDIGLVKQEEKVKIIRNTKGFNFEYTLLGKPEDNLDRVEKINEELEKRLDK